MGFREDDVVLCKVKKIEGTTVFLEIEGGGHGSMVLSEVAAGRIRNLRDYVFPNKVVVCKILKSGNGVAELSLRRVTAKEREEVLERYKKERAFENILKIFGENPDEVMEKINQDYSFLDFIDEARNDPRLLARYVKKDNVDRIFNRLQEKGEKKKVVSKRIKLSSFESSGLSDIKEVFASEDADVHYRGSSVFSVSVTGKDFKEANHKLEETLLEIEKKAKSKKILFEKIKEKHS